MIDDPICWYCNDTGMMSILVDKEGQVVSTTSDGWPEDIEIGTPTALYHWKKVPCKHCEPNLDNGYIVRSR